MVLHSVDLFRAVALPSQILTLLMAERVAITEQIESTEREGWHLRSEKGPMVFALSTVKVPLVSTQLTKLDLCFERVAVQTGFVGIVDLWLVAL